MSAAVPGGSARPGSLDLPPAATEEDVARELRDLAARNRPAEPMIGLGYHGTLTPPVIRRNVLEDPSWYTAYTPYQPEISQGRLEALLNFQTVVGDLTGLPTANASLLDEGTAAAEAMTLVRRGNRTATGPFVVDADALPQTIEVVRTRAEAMGIDVRGGRPRRRAPGGRALRRAAAVPGRLRPDPRPAAARRGRARPERAGRRGRRPARPDAARVARAPSGRTSWSARPSASASRCSTAARTPATWPSPLASSGTCPAAWSGSPSTPRGARPTASPCRPASSTSAGTRRPPTSAPPRCCSPSWPRCTPSTTARRACGRSRDAPTSSPLAPPRPSPGAGFEVLTPNFFDTFQVSAPGRAAEVVGAARLEGLHLLLVDQDTVGLSFSEVSTAATLRKRPRGVRRHARADRAAGGPACRAVPRRRRSSPTRCSRRTAARPRCCATCVASRPATTRWTAA